MRSYIKGLWRDYPALILTNLVMIAAVGAAFSLGIFDLHAAGTLVMCDVVPASVADLKALEKSMKEVWDGLGVNLRKAQDTADQALSESKKYGGVIEAKTQDSLKKIDEVRADLQEKMVEVRNQILDVAQKLATVPQGLPQGAGDDLEKLITESDAWKAAQSKGIAAREMEPISIGNVHRFGFRNTQITNPNPLSNDQPLVPAQRLPGIITPAEQRLFIRDLIPVGRATSNLIEFASESAFTSAARPQGDVSPVGHGEGELKAESAFTFALASAPVVTIAHWVPASRQVLSDAAMLMGHIQGRLLYGLKLEEESEILTGVGAAGELNGINNQATAFNGGVTNQTILDTLLKAFLQVSLSNYEASGVIMHPTDWVNAMLLKDTQGRYLFTNPQDMAAPRIWAKPVVATQSQTLGKFTTGAFNLACQIWDKEDATVRVSENVNDHFIRNLVAVLCEERLAFVVYRALALVYGNVSHAG